jgi:hypothetical protein
MSAILSHFAEAAAPSGFAAGIADFPQVGSVRAAAEHPGTTAATVVRDRHVIVV